MNILNNYCMGIFGDGNGIPEIVGDLIHYVYIGVKIVVPILLVFFGMLDLGKAITAKKEEDIKKYQGTCIKRVVTGVLVFLVIFVVEYLLNFVEQRNSYDDESPVKCAMQLIRGNSNSNKNVTSH